MGNTFGDIEISKLDDTIRAFIKDSDITILFNPKDNTWSIEASFAHIERTTGPCGIINNDMNDDQVEFDQYKVESEKYECMFEKELQCTGCECLNHPVFAACHDHVAVASHLATCRYRRDDLGMCDHCTSLASYFAECKKAGICLDYKENTCCGSDSKQCEEGKTYQQCGPCVQKTCTNMETYDQ